MSWRSTSAVVLSMGFVALAMVNGACVDVRTTNCDSRVCPVGWSCNDVLDECFSSDQTLPCVGEFDGTPCQFSDVPQGRCEAGVCLGIVCGNDRIDPGEVCDDGNTASGDGCSATCESLEVCGNSIVDPSGGEQCDDGNQLSHDGCSSGCTSEQAAWTPINPSEFSTRSHVALAYDAGRQRVVMFGGRIQTGNGQSDATWEYDGQHWARLKPVASPPERDGAAMVYDPVNRRIVLFGGRGGAASDGILADTWTFDGTTWTQLSTTTSPTARTEHSMAYDAANQRIVLFGGMTATWGVWRDTWVFENGDWTEVGAGAAVKPPGRIGRTLAYHTQLDKLFLHGGFGKPTSSFEWLADTWEWTGTEWTPVAGPQPAGRGDLVYDSRLDRLIVAGGLGTAVFSQWLGGSWSNIVPGEELPYFTDTVFDAQRGVVVRVGGLNGLGKVSQTWELATNVWVLRDDLGAPTSRQSTLMTFDTRRQRAVLYGGRDSLNDELRDTWELVDGAWRRVSMKVEPGVGLNYNTAVYDQARGAMRVFYAGSGGVREYSFEGGLWKGTLAIAAGSGKLYAAYDSDRQIVVLVVFDRTYEFDGDTWQQIDTGTLPDGLGSGAAVYDPVNRRVVLFSELGDTWVYELSGTQWSWRKLATQGAPSGRSKPGFVFHEARGTLIMFGGDVFDVGRNDLWELKGSTWSEVPTALVPLARVTPGMAYDPASKSAIIYGSQPRRGTWALRWVSTHPDEDCTAAGDEDGDGVANCADPDCNHVSCGSAGERCVAGACICPGGATEQFCGDNFDDDCDGAVDCDDSDCATAPHCNVESDCRNGIDDDGDGMRDCAEPQCAGVDICEAFETSCSDGMDNDGDGKADCFDPDCYLVACPRILSL